MKKKNKKKILYDKEQNKMEKFEKRKEKYCIKKKKNNGI